MVFFYKNKQDNVVSLYCCKIFLHFLTFTMNDFKRKFSDTNVQKIRIYTYFIKNISKLLKPYHIICIFVRNKTEYF